MDFEAGFLSFAKDVGGVLCHFCGEGEGSGECKESAEVECEVLHRDFVCLECMDPRCEELTQSLKFSKRMVAVVWAMGICYHLYRQGQLQSRMKMNSFNIHTSAHFNRID